MKKILNKYENYLRTTLRRSENTIKSYMSNLMNFEGYADKEITDITTSDLMDYIDYISTNGGKSGSGLSAESVNRNISALRGFFEWACDMDIIKENVAQKLKFASVQKHKEVIYLNNEQSKEFMSTIHNDDKKERCPDYAKCRDEFIFLTYLQTGIRASELVNITLDDIDIRNKKIRIVGKGNKIRYVAITEKMDYLYHMYVRERDNIKIKDEDYLFLSVKGRKLTTRTINELTKGYAQKSNIDKKIANKLSAHKLRHSYSSNQYANHVPIKEISESLGHSNINITMEIYTHISNEDILNSTRKASETLNDY